MLFTDYCNTLNLQIHISYLPNTEEPWIVAIQDVEFKTNKHSAIIGTECGRGISLNFALANFLKRIEGKIIVIRALDEEKRQEFKVPLNLERRDLNDI